MQSTQSSFRPELDSIVHSERTAIHGRSMTVPSERCRIPHPEIRLHRGRGASAAAKRNPCAARSRCGSHPSRWLFLRQRLAARHGHARREAQPADEEEGGQFQQGLGAFFAPIWAWCIVQLEFRGPVQQVRLAPVGTQVARSCPIAVHCEQRARDRHPSDRYPRAGGTSRAAGRRCAAVVAIGRQSDMSWAARHVVQLPAGRRQAPLPARETPATGKPRSNTRARSIATESTPAACSHSHSGLVPPNTHTGPSAPFLMPRRSLTNRLFHSRMIREGTPQGPR